MTKIQYFVLVAVAGPILCFGRGSTEKAPVSTSRETASQTVEDGGTGAYKALMASDESLPTHTLFRRKDLGQGIVLLIASRSSKKLVRRN